MTLSDVELSGKLVVEARGVAKSFEGRAIVRDLSLRILRGDRLGIVGPNGAGKTTLLNLLTGGLAPDAGAVRLGANLRIAALDQRRESLRAEASVAETLTGGGGEWVEVGGRRKHVVAYMKEFLFAPEQARTPVRALSGGERNRLTIARALAQPSNLLVLDEPTNDLDLETLELLQEMVADYPGTVLAVSHDRDFLDRVVTATLVAEGEGRWVEHAGGYTDMVAQRGAGVAALVTKETPPAVRKAAATPKPATPKRKLSFNERHDLGTLPSRIAGLQSLIADLHASLGDAGLYSRDPALFERTSAALASAQADLSSAENRWLTLEMLREELEP